MSHRFNILILFLFIFIGCTSTKKATLAVDQYSYKLYAVQSNSPNTVLQELIDPYNQKMKAQMDEVIGECETMLEKKQPEGTLNNFMADAMRFQAEKKFNKKVDIAFVNYGGIRIANVAKGKIAVGKVYELMPFDNIIVLQKVPGSILQRICNHLASKGGWPSSGIEMQIKDGKAINVKVSGEKLDESKTYTVANSDYIANGGDELEYLKNIPQENRGYLFRDAIIDYIRDQTKQGKKISATLQNRISYAQ